MFRIEKHILNIVTIIFIYIYFLVCILYHRPEDDPSRPKHVATVKT